MSTILLYIQKILLENERRLVVFCYRFIQRYIRFANWVFKKAIAKLEKDIPNAKPEARNGMYKKVESIKTELKDNERWLQQLEDEMQQFL